MAAGNILVVDDDQNLLELLKMRLESAEYEVATAGGEAEALAAVKKQGPDLAILDLKLGDGDGIAFTVTNQGEAPSMVNGVELAPGKSLAGRSEGPRSPAAEPSGKETYRERLRWADGPRELIVTAVREAAPEGAQILDAGLPFRPEDLAAFLAARPRSLERIVIHGSAQTYDHRTLKPLMKVLEHAAVKRELDAFRGSGGQLIISQ